MKLLELKIQNLIITGELVQPNYFRLTIASSNLLQCYDLIRKFNYRLQGISVTDQQSCNYVEYFFTYLTSDRELLLAIDVFIDESTTILPSLTNWEPAALVYEEYINKFTSIEFAKASRSSVLIEFT